MTTNMDPRLEYAEASENVRHFGNLRFAQMTLFFVVSGAIYLGLYQYDFEAQSPMAILLRVAGILLAVMFMLLDARIMEYWHHFRERAKQLERELGFEQYSRAPVHRTVSATNIITLFYFAVMAFWVIGGLTAFI